jgi:hypothetical protein
MLLSPSDADVYPTVAGRGESGLDSAGQWGWESGPRSLKTVYFRFQG